MISRNWWNNYSSDNSWCSSQQGYDFF